MKKILVTVNPEYEPADGTSFDAVLSALEHFDIPANLVEVNQNVPNPKGDALVDALKICGGIIDWAIDHGGDKVSLESIKRMSVEAIANYEDADGVDKQKEEFLAMQAEIESIEMSVAKGEETDHSDARLRELYDRMEESPWEIDPDEGVREKPANANRP